MKFPPHNQRRLNVKIKEIYAGRYADWHELAIEMMSQGHTLADIANQFGILGVPVSLYTVHKWLKARQLMTINQR